MKLSFISYGKVKTSFIGSQCEDYRKRIKRFTTVDTVVLKEAKIKNSKEIPAALAKEAKSLQPYLENPGVFNILLDEKGKQLTSKQLAKLLKDKQMNGQVKRINLIVGSAHGVDPHLKKKIPYHLGLSLLTLPHEYAYLLLHEQIYRAFTINNGIPYHHE